MSALTTITTAEQLFGAGDIGRCELIAGELRVMTPSGYEHGRIAARITSRIFNFVDERDLGDVVTDDSGFILSRRPDTVRGADCAFASKARSKTVRPEKGGYGLGAPDLVIEVNSPNDTQAQIAPKVQDWLGAGCILVVVIDPETKTINVHRTGGVVKVLTMADDLRLEPVLAGFGMQVREVFR